MSCSGTRREEEIDRIRLERNSTDTKIELNELAMTAEMVEYGLKEDLQPKDDDLEASNRNFFKHVSTQEASNRNFFERITSPRQKRSPKPSNSPRNVRRDASKKDAHKRDDVLAV